MQRTLRAILVSSVVLAAGSVAIAPALAAPVFSELSDAYNVHTDNEFRQGLQMRLAWTGDYVGNFDGRVGPLTLRAIRDFQARNGLPADGVMSEAFLVELIRQSDEAQDRVGFAWTDDAETGVRVGLPTRLVSAVGRTEVGSMWRSDDDTIEVETVRFTEEGYGLADVYAILKAETAGKRIYSADLIGDRFILTGHEDGRDFFIRFDGEGSDLRGFSVAYAPERAAELAPYIAVAEATFEPYAMPAARDFGPMAEMARDERFAQAFASPNTLVARTTPNGEAAGRNEPAFDASGTGFVVADEWLLTNAHVAKSCSAVMVGELGAASQVIIDEDNDLALLRVEADLGAPLPLVEGKPRLGEDILALGFPLRSILADSLNVTRGNVSSLLGLMNDPNYLQISAAVQPGNSGGPVVDLAGRVVGVVTAKLNAVAVADLTGDIPQTINFAIRPDAAARFLSENRIAFDFADADLPLQSVPDATASVQDSILPILCLGGN